MSTDRRITELRAEVARLKRVAEAHGPVKRRCACPGCRKMIPSCWRSVLCYECGSEDCYHAQEKP